MDHKTTGIISFLPYWDVRNPSLEDQTGFIISEMFEEDECLKIGDKVYSSNDFHKKDPKEFIREVIRKERPEWVIGIGNIATILMEYKRQKKIVINPTVTLDDLNWVTPEMIRDTYAFFSADHEKDYEMYSRVYRNVGFFPAKKSLFIGDLTSAIKGIIKESREIAMQK
ncbi:MAG: hypothetical protein K2K98_02225 [Muribaculaceae bacterium]|nr:hypothetical protein [Muribaculaceae bacterium]